MTYYDVLGIPQNASREDIRAAYLAQIRYFHPDVFPGNPEIAKLKTLQLNEAYSVLYNPDRRTQYDWILNHATKGPASPPPPPSSTSQSKTSPRKNTQRSSADIFETIKVVCAILAISIISIAVALTSSGDDDDTPEAPAAQEEYEIPASSPKAEYEYIPVSLPENGQILYENGWDRVAPFSVVTRGEDNFLIKLKTSTGTQDILTFFVRAGETVEIDVPLGNYTLYYATGETWYGEDILFGESTLYYKADDLFDFYEEDGSINGWTVELYLQNNGNLSTESIVPSEF